MTVESLKSFFDWATVVCIALTVFTGAGALITGRTINKRQDDRLQIFQKNLTNAQTDLSKQKEQTAKMEEEALSLQKQLAFQGSRVALLYGKNRENLVNRLKPFKNQKVEVRFCRVSFNQFSIDNEAMGLATLLRTILANYASWEVNPPVIENCGGTGIDVSINPKASGSTRSAAAALWTALNGVPLKMIGDKPFATESPRPEQPQMFDCGTTSDCANTPVVMPPLGHDTIVLTVLGHP